MTDDPNGITLGADPNEPASMAALIQALKDNTEVHRDVITHVVPAIEALGTKVDALTKQIGEHPGLMAFRFSGDNGLPAFSGVIAAIDNLRQQLAGSAPGGARWSGSTH